MYLRGVIMGKHQSVLDYLDYGSYLLLDNPKYLKEQRDKMGYTQAEVAKLCGFTTRQYAKYEYEPESLYKASFFNVARVCQVLDIDIDALCSFPTFYRE